MGLLITLILIGFVLILAEILIIPGVGVAGVLGLLSLGGSCYYAFYEFGSLTGGIVTGVMALILLLLTVYVLRAKTWKRFALETNIDSKAVSAERVLIESNMRREKRKNVVDQVAATFILQNYLDKIKK